MRITRKILAKNLGIVVDSFGKSKSVKKIRHSIEGFRSHLDSWWLMVGVSSGITITRDNSTARVGQWYCLRLLAHLLDSYNIGVYLKSNPCVGL